MHHLFAHVDIWSFVGLAVAAFTVWLIVPGYK